MLTDGPFDEAAAAFSPDGRWLALESDESGRTEIVVRDLADGRRVAVSTDGGTHPRWSADGRVVILRRGTPADARRVRSFALNRTAEQRGRRVRSHGRRASSR